MDIDLSKYPKFTQEQTGHLRHFHNLVTQPDGDWHHMGSQEPLQEFLDAYRYQLATISYATALTHYHHQPLLRSVYKSLFRSTIHKMLRKEVWAYWFTTSLGGITTDPSLKELRKPWADPVVRENIMYSGHLLLMLSLYSMLFDDDEFEKEGALIFHWNPLFYGLGSETFTYDVRSLQEAILKEMEGNGWVGVCCEPNAVFVVCNQFPMIAMRLNDVRHGTNIVEDVLTKYKAAWEKKGMLSPDGLFKDMWLAKQDITIPAMDPGFGAWACAFMNTWNSSFVRSCYERQSFGHLTTIDGQTRLHPPVVGTLYRKLAAEDTEGKLQPKELLKKASKEAKSTSAERLAAKSPSKPLTLLTKPIFGYVVKWLSELGKKEQLTGLLEYANSNLRPTWEKGGVFYPRNDEPMDVDMQWTHMDPFTGNAAIGYARLNVEDGMKKIWEGPWTKDEVQNRPWVDGLSMADAINFSRGVWDEGNGVAVITMRTWDGSGKTLKPVFKGLEEGTWEVFVDGDSKAKVEIRDGGEITFSMDVGAEDVDVVAIKRG